MLQRIVNSNKDILVKLLNKIAPSYEPENIIAHLRLKFEHLNEDDFLVRCSECLKFLYLRSLSGRGFIPLSEEIDLIWHEFILQTREYATFCRCLPGGDFIHHNTSSLNGHAEKVSVETSVRNLVEWIPAYIQHFGKFTKQAAEYWMIVQVLDKEFGYTPEQINQLRAHSVES